MSKKIEKNEIVEEFFRRNDPKNIKSMNYMYDAWKDLSAPAFQQLLNAEMGEIPVKIPRDRNGEIDSDLVPKYSRTANWFDEKIIAMYALGLSDKDIHEQIKDIFGCDISPDMISDITQKIIQEIQECKKED